MMNRLVSLLRLASLMLCAVLLMPSARAATWYVATTGSDSNPGTTAAKPFLTIGKAVNTANGNDTILVADGTYSGVGNRNMDFGGVDLIIHSVSGIPANCIIDCQQSGCAFILQNNQTASSNIAGFTIKNGTGIGSLGLNNGGGICISQDDLNPVISNCVFTRNSATYRGGGMAYGTVTNCVFIGNSARNGGGGLAYSTATNCVFMDNSASSGGGMINVTAFSCRFIGNSAGNGGGMQSSTATNCVFTGNSAGNGGGMQGSTATNCVFTGNSAGNGGGMDSSTVMNCVFTGNSASGGGGMGSGIATNCVFTGNSAQNGGGMGGGMAINCVFTGNSASISGGGGSGDFYFCTLANNYATVSGGGVYAYNNTITNCIIWGNTVGGSSPNITGTGTVTYSDIQRGFTGAGNINANPLFVNSNSGNLHLMAGSPCINVGTITVPVDQNGTPVAFPTTDLDGGNRIVGSAPDMGAYEYGNVGVYGKITFDGIAPNAPAQIVTFQFRPSGGGAAINTTYFTTSDGAFYLYGVPNGSYKMWVKSPTYLAVAVPVTVAGGVASITATLEPGDANNDNSVDSSDFGVLIGAFNTSASVPGSGYDPTADFNGDGFVDSTDFGLLIGNFNTVGAP